MATATPWPAARSSRPRWEMGLGGENGGGEHRRSSGGSQRIHSRRGRGRGRSGADESGDGDRRVRGGEKRRGGASGASGGAWLGEVGRGRSGGACGLVGEAREARWPWWQWTAATSSARWLRARNRGGGRSEESERGSQGLRGDARRAVASRWKQEVAGEAGGGRGSVGARRPRALPTGAGKTTGGGRLVGWAAPVGCQHRSWAGWLRGEHQVSPGGLSLSFFIFLFSIFFKFVLALF